MWDVILAIILFIVGLILIIKGGDVFVDASTWFAEVLGIPKIIVGATIVSFATTLPEMMVSLLAAIDGKIDMALGNAIGSVTANLGIAFSFSILFIPLILKRKGFMAKALIMLACCVVLFIFGRLGYLSWLGCVILLALCVLFFIINIREAKISLKDNSSEVKIKPTKKVCAINIVKFIVGALAIAGGAQLLVDNGSFFARIIGIPESIIGATIIAVGTSLPEIVTAITSIIKKQSSLSVGNIIGANIIDLAVILPICTLVGGGNLAIVGQSANVDLPFCLGIIGLAMIPTFFTQKAQRWQGALLIISYVAYLVIMCVV